MVKLEAFPNAGCFIVLVNTRKRLWRYKKWKKKQPKFGDWDKLGAYLFCSKIFDKMIGNH